MKIPNAPPRPALNSRGRQLAIAVIVLLIVVLLVRALFGHRENQYEKLANNLTVALQKDDVDTVRNMQNAETATTITRGIVGRASDALAPLGKITSVKEVTTSNAPARTHDFSVTFDKGAVHERMKVDPDGKIVHFAYEPVAQ